MIQYREPVANELNLMQQVAAKDDRSALGGEPRDSSRTSRVPSGSRPFVGSSRMTMRVSRTRVSAMPNCCFIPSEQPLNL